MENNGIENILKETAQGEEGVKRVMESFQGDYTDAIKGIAQSDQGKAIFEQLKGKGLDPEQIANSEDPAQAAAELRNAAEKIALQDQGKKLLESVKDKGVNVKAMKKDMDRMQSEINRAQRKNKKIQKAVVITQTRKLKQIEIETESKANVIAKQLNVTKEVHEARSYRLAVGPWEGCSVKMWYDPSLEKSKNRRATNILGFNVGGSILIYIPERDITLKEMETVEDLIEKKEKGTDIDKLLSED